METLRPKKHIIEKGYPITSKYYPVAHMLASREEKNKFGSKPYKQLESIAIKHPGELLGTHTAKGHVTLSFIVPKSLISEVDFHERRETEWMIKLRGKHGKT